MPQPKKDPMSLRINFKHLTDQKSISKNIKETKDECQQWDWNKQGFSFQE